jgi:hypothetical protein
MFGVFICDMKQIASNYLGSKGRVKLKLSLCLSN